MNVLIAGAGGFIGGHFSKHFCSKKNVNLTCVDIKKKNWYQKFTNSKNIVSDLSIYQNCIKALKKIDYVEKVQRMAENRSFSHSKAYDDFGYSPMNFKEGIEIEVYQYLNKKRGK